MHYLESSVQKQNKSYPPIFYHSPLYKISVERYVEVGQHSSQIPNRDVQLLDRVWLHPWGLAKNKEEIRNVSLSTA